MIFLCVSVSEKAPLHFYKRVLETNNNCYAEKSENML